jgi:hypothetical protein
MGLLYWSLILEALSFYKKFFLSLFKKQLGLNLKKKLKILGFIKKELDHINWGLGGALVA